MEEGKGMKKIYGVMSFMSVIYMFSTVASIEGDQIALLGGVIHLVISLIFFGLFSRLANFFYTEDTAEGHDVTNDGRGKTTI